MRATCWITACYIRSKVLLQVCQLRKAIEGAKVVCDVTALHPGIVHDVTSCVTPGCRTRCPDALLHTMSGCSVAVQLPWLAVPLPPAAAMSQGLLPLHSRRRWRRTSHSVAGLRIQVSCVTVLHLGVTHNIVTSHMAS